MAEKILHPWVGKTLRQYRKKKGLTQEELGQAVAKFIEAQAGRQEKGLSKSAISRIEKATFIPPKNKLEIIINLLDIQNPQDRQRLFELCGYSPPQAVVKTEAREEKLQEAIELDPDDPLKWLELISVLNQEKRYDIALETISDAQVAFLRIKHQGLRNIAEQLLNSKQQFTYALQLELDNQASEPLKRSIIWADQANQSFKQYKNKLDEVISSAQLHSEVLRTQITALFEQFHRNFLLSPDNQSLKQAEKEFTKIIKKIQRAEKLFENGHLPEDEHSIYRFLYIQREKASLEFKWLEIQEIFKLQEYLREKNPELFKKRTSFARVPLIFYQKLTQKYNKQKTQVLELLESLYIKENQQVIFLPARDLQSVWDSYQSELDRFLSTHQRLVNYAVAPDTLPMVPIVNTSLLYVAALARLGYFKQNEARLFLNTLYFLTNSHTLPTWNYVSSYFFAWRYLATQDSEDLDKCISYWMQWSQSTLALPERYDPQRFEALLQEPCLWRVFLPTLLDKRQNVSDYIKWLKPKLVHLFETKLSGG